ncbi:MAG: pyroglutamyl-peptidase I [Chloroflexi bacterium]|nr:MAG: pyroglutamyl-peptidase I [Chloroflexota bacterium]
MKILLTGFEPFNKQPINPSQEIVKALADTQIEGVELVTAVLPVDRFEGPDALMRAYIKNQPDGVVCLGEAGHRPAIAVERVAINLLDFRIEDNKGVQISDKPIMPNEPAAFFTTLPARKIVEDMQAAGVPSTLSLSAGAFLCNQVFYTLMQYLNKYQLEIPAGFIHVPRLPEQVVGIRPLSPSMGLETMCKGIAIALETIVTT